MNKKLFIFLMSAIIGTTVYSIASDKHEHVKRMADLALQTEASREALQYVIAKAVAGGYADEPVTKMHEDFEFQKIQYLYDK